jgi:uncharacterized membrane protein HdeD (DUF308 family)
LRAGALSLQRTKLDWETDFPSLSLPSTDGIITLVVGLLVLAQWPASGLWVIGLFIGIDLIFYGAAWIALALGLRASS